MKPLFNQIFLPVTILFCLVLFQACEVTPDLPNRSRSENIKKRTENSNPYFFKAYVVDSVRNYISQVNYSCNNNLFLTGFSYTNGYTFLNVLRLDSLGQMDWNYNYDLDGGYLGVLLTKILNDNEILTGGYFTNIELDNERIFFLKLDQNGSVIFTNCYDVKGGSSGADIIQLKNGDLLLTTNLFNPYAFLIARFSENGELIWSKKMENNPPIVGANLEETENGEIWLTGYHNIRISNAMQQNFFILKLNDKAEIVEQKSFGIPNHIIYTQALDSRKEKLLIKGKIGKTPSYGNPVQYKDFFAEFDSNGEFLWSRLFDESFNIRKVVYLSDGRIFTGGEKRTSRYPDICFQFFNDQGIPQSAYRIGGEKYESIGNFEISASDNSITFAGSTESWSSTSLTTGLIVGRFDLSFGKPATPFCEIFVNDNVYENIKFETGTIDIILEDFELQEVPFHLVQMKKAEPKIINLENNRIRN